MTFCASNLFCANSIVFAQHWDFSAQEIQQVNCCRGGLQVVDRYTLEDTYLLYIDRLRQWIQQDPDNNSEGNFCETVRAHCVSCLCKIVCICAQSLIFAHNQ